MGAQHSSPAAKNQQAYPLVCYSRIMPEPASSSRADVDLVLRQHLLRDLGGLPETGVRNTEWLYMLQEETRQSLSIEGYFATEQELRAVLAGRKTFPEILNYFRAAQGLYDLAWQHQREDELGFTLAVVRHAHSELFRELDERRGEFRRASIRIQGAQVTPPERDVEEYVRVFVRLVPTLMSRFSTVPALARVHTLFESIHPFADGNGRAGRILMNYLAVTQGLPPVIIKGDSQAERDRYYAALEAGDRGFHARFPLPEERLLLRALDAGDFGPLEHLLREGVRPQLDRMIVAAAETKGDLRELRDLAPEFGVKEATLRQWVARGRLIAVKRGRRLVSHPLLFLGGRPAQGEE